MQVNYLNLDRRPDRNLAFLELNRSVVDCRRIAAVDGSRLSRDELVASGIIEPDLNNYSSGALGAAVSHLRVWRLAVEENVTLTVAEDDAVFNCFFVKSAYQILGRLPTDWDIILWGWNFDSILHVGLFDGLNEAISHFSRRTLSDDIVRFRERIIEAAPLKLINAFGTVCYTISPRGAGKLLDRCFPLRNEVIPVPGLNANLCNMGIDTAMNKHYRELKAYACFPPLVWTENDKSQSDILPSQ